MAETIFRNETQNTFQVLDSVTKSTILSETLRDFHRLLNFDVRSHSEKGGSIVLAETKKIGFSLPRIFEQSDMVGWLYHLPLNQYQYQTF